MCNQFGDAELAEKEACLNNVQTRTSGAWHLFYALFGKIE
jgi:hypothetical protein